MGTCGGPAHLTGENLDAVYPPELRCQSQEAMLKAEFEEASRITPPPTEEPENKVKCPANCACEVSAASNVGLLSSHFFSTYTFFSGLQDYHDYFYHLLKKRVSLSLVFRPRHNTPRVKIVATPKSLGGSLPTRASLTCVATTSTTSLATASPVSARWCPYICSAARLWRWRTGLSAE